MSVKPREDVTPMQHSNWAALSAGLAVVLSVIFVRTIMESVKDACTLLLRRQYKVVLFIPWDTMRYLRKLQAMHEQVFGRPAGIADVLASATGDEFVIFERHLMGAKFISQKPDQEPEADPFGLEAFEKQHLSAAE